MDKSVSAQPSSLRKNRSLVHCLTKSSKADQGRGSKTGAGGSDGSHVDPSSTCKRFMILGIYKTNYRAWLGIISAIVKGKLFGNSFQIIQMYNRSIPLYSSQILQHLEIGDPGV